MAELKTRSGETKPAETKASTTAKKTAEKAPAEKKATEKPAAEKKAPRKDDNGKTVMAAKPQGGATGKRVGAVILWVLAIVCEVVAFLCYFGKINITFVSTLVWIIALFVIDLICVVAGSLLWKHANHIDPASEKNKVKFFLWNNMGLIVSIFAFLPVIILLLRDKDKLDKKTKTIAIIAGVVAMLIAGATSIDYNPVSQESKAEAVATIDGNVYWTQFGKVYHVDANCQHINNSDSYYEGTVTEAIDSNRTRLCKTCAKNNNISIEATQD